MERIAAAATVSCLLLAGCAGHATIHLIPLGGKSISTTSPLVQKFTPEECYYWVNDNDELHVAMRDTPPSLPGDRFKREFILSLVLEGLPAGHGRNYPAGRRTMRARGRSGYRQTRAASLAGIAAIWDYGRHRLRGRFRFSAKHQTYSILTGWSGDTGVLIVGDFTAVPNRRAGEKIYAQTEERGMERLPPGRETLRTDLRAGSSSG